jgi:hypothetical protein
MKEMTYRVKVHTREELLHGIMDYAAYIPEQPKIIQRTVEFCLKRARLCADNRVGHFEQLQD